MLTRRSGSPTEQSDRQQGTHLWLALHGISPAWGSPLQPVWAAHPPAQRAAHCGSTVGDFWGHSRDPPHLALTVASKLRPWPAARGHPVTASHEVPLPSSSGLCTHTDLLVGPFVTFRTMEKVTFMARIVPKWRPEAGRVLDVCSRLWAPRLPDGRHPHGPSPSLTGHTAFQIFKAGL